MHKKGTNYETYLGGELSLWGEGGIQSQQEKKIYQTCNRGNFNFLQQAKHHPSPNLDTKTWNLRKEKTFENHLLTSWFEKIHWVSGVRRRGGL